MYIQVAPQLIHGAPPQSRVTVSRTSTSYQPVHQAMLESRRTTPGNGAPTTYTVQPGDNLSRIVREHIQRQGGTASMQEVYSGVERVAQANRLRDPDMIHPGQQIDLSILGGEAQPLALPEAAPRVSMAPLPAPEHVSRIPLVSPQIQPANLERYAAGGAPEALPAVESKVAEVPQAPMPVASGGPALSGTATRALEMLREAPQHLANITDLIRDVMEGREIETTAPVHAPWNSSIGGDARLTSNYGMRKDPFTGQPGFHDGIDLAAEAGSPIYPIEPGRVVFSGWQTGYGRVVIVEHDNGLESIYAHNDVNHVQVGDVVTKETVLGDVGSSGRSTGPHLHLEIRQHGKAVNPISHLGGGPHGPHLHAQ